MSAPSRSNSVERGVAVGGDRDLEALLAQHVGQRVAVALLVLDDEYPGHLALSSVVVGCPGSSGGRRGQRSRVNVEPWPSTDHTRDLAAVGGGDVLDDGQAEAGAAGGAVAGRVDAVEALEDPVDAPSAGCRCPGRRPRSRPARSSARVVTTHASSRRRSRRRRWRPGCSTAARICSCVAEHLRPCSPPATTLDPLASASMRAGVDGRGDHRRRGRPSTGVSSGSSPCSRESSMICCTSRASRSLSVSIRPAKRWTASGSSAASVTASASSRIAPTGVFSSWLTLATKSRRTASTRRSRVRSSTSASTRRGAERRDAGGDVRATGAVGRGQDQLGLADLAVAAHLRDQRRPARATTSVLPRTRPKAYAGAVALRTTSSARRRRRRCCAGRDSTAATPAGHGGLLDAPAACAAGGR